MNPFALSGLLAGLTSLGFGLVVFLKSDNRALGRAWFLFSLSVSVWGFGSMMIGLNTNSQNGLFIWRLAHGLGVVWIPPLFLHFVRTFIGSSDKTIKFHYLAGLFFAGTTLTPFFFHDAHLMFNSFVYAIGGMLYPIYSVWWFGVVGLSHYYLIKAYQRAGLSMRNRIKYFFLATAVGFSGGAMCFIPNFGIEIYPVGNFSICLYPFIMSYAILRYQLMDIRVFFRRVGLFVVVYLILILGIFPLLPLLHKNALSLVTSSPFLYSMEIILVGGVLSLGPFLYAYVVKRSGYFHEQTMAGLTHELKSPLAAIQSALEMITDLSGPAPLSKKQSEYFDLIERNTERLSQFIEDLLQVFQVQNKTRPIMDRDVDLGLLCLKAAQYYEPLAQFKGNTIEVEIKPDQFILSCDQKKMEYVLSNLLSNAVKFTMNGTIEISATRADHLVTLSVTDSGSGIPSHELDRVFDRFFQGKKAGANKGTGIGLTIAKTWVEAHGGRIWAESEGEGKGTTVRFTVPINL